MKQNDLVRVGLIAAASIVIGVANIAGAAVTAANYILEKEDWYA